MAVKYRYGDLFKDAEEIHVVAHQCNTLGSFGAGFAKTVKRLFPEVDRAQRELYKAGGQKLGEIQIVQTHLEHLSVANLYAQSSVTRIPGRTNTKYDALLTCLQKLKQTVPSHKVLAMPQIGAGLGGGDWTRIEQMIQETFEGRDVYVYIYKH